MTIPINFVTRVQWASTFDYSGNTLMPTTCEGVALHWEGGGLGPFAHTECSGQVRAIEKFHVETRDWAGIAYNALVCPHGYIFEGRGTKYRSAANGDVAKNNAWFAVCFLGGTGDVFTDAAKVAKIRSVQWLRANAGAGPRVIGHRDITATACPGDEIEAWLKMTNFDNIATVPVPTPAPVVIPPAILTAVWNQPATWKLGAMGPDVKKLGDRILVWGKALGLPSPYKIGPGEPLGQADVAGLSAIQKKWWPNASVTLGGDADGYPGLETFKRLDADPIVSSPTPITPEEPVTKLSVLHWNVAGSDDTNGYGAANAYRGGELGRYAHTLGFDVFLVCEAGQDNLRNDISVGLGLAIGATEWMQRAKAIWYASSRGIKNISARKAYRDSFFAYFNTYKWGAAFFGIKDGKMFSVLEIHTDYRAPAKQAKQVQSIFKKWRVDCDSLGIKHVNTYVVGDFNWDGTSGDNPFHALDSWNFHEKGDRNENTFMERKHLDGVLAHREAYVEVDVKPRTDGVRKLSDHNPVKFVATLQ